MVHPGPAVLHRGSTGRTAGASGVGRSKQRPYTATRPTSLSVLVSGNRGGAFGVQWPAVARRVGPRDSPPRVWRRGASPGGKMATNPGEVLPVGSLPLQPASAVFD